MYMLYIRVLENREMAGKEFGGEFFGGACATRSTSCVWLGYTERACVRVCAESKLGGRASELVGFKGRAT